MEPTDVMTNRKQMVTGHADEKLLLRPAHTPPTHFDNKIYYIFDRVLHMATVL